MFHLTYSLLHLIILSFITGTFLYKKENILLLPLFLAVTCIMPSVWMAVYTEPSARVNSHSNGGFQTKVILHLPFQMETIFFSFHFSEEVLLISSSHIVSPLHQIQTLLVLSDLKVKVRKDWKGVSIWTPGLSTGVGGGHSSAPLKSAWSRRFAALHSLPPSLLAS